MNYLKHCFPLRFGFGNEGTGGLLSPINNNHCVEQVFALINITNIYTNTISLTVIEEILNIRQNIPQEKFKCPCILLSVCP